MAPSTNKKDNFKAPISKKSSDIVKKVNVRRVPPPVPKFDNETKQNNSSLSPSKKANPLMKNVIKKDDNIAMIKKNLQAQEQYQSGKSSVRCGGRTAMLLNNRPNSGKNSVRTPIQALKLLQGSPENQKKFESPEDLF